MSQRLEQTQLTALEKDPLHMNQHAFEFAIEGVKLHGPTKEAARLILVEKLKRQEVMDKTGVDSGTLSKAMSRIQENFEKRLAEEDLVHKDWVIPKKLEAFIDFIESGLLEKFLKKK